jgi:hypothetical protein
MKTSIKELQTMSETDKIYRILERTEEMHAEGMYVWGVWCKGFQLHAVMQDKWTLAKFEQNNAVYGGH